MFESMSKVSLPETDVDLATHITIIRDRGITLYGDPSRIYLKKFRLLTISIVTPGS